MATMTTRDGSNAAPPAETKGPPTDDDIDTSLVGWEPNDRENPRNWPTLYKAWLTCQLGLLALAGSLASSITAPAEDAMAAEFDISSEVAVLSVSLYVIGFVFGPVCWAPVSELWGRRLSLLPAVFGLGLFSIGTATSKSAASVFVTRFFGGVFGSGPVSNVAATLGDLYAPKARGMAVTFYAIAVVGGPTWGPVIGAALTVNPKLGWRWTEYIEAIYVFAVCALSFFALPETYEPVLLKRRAQRLRKETGNEALYHPHENIKLSPRDILTKHFSRPILMLVTEPMVLCIAFYASFVYGLLYMTLEVYPIVFEENRGYSPVVASLPFIALFIGVLCAVGINLTNQQRYARLSKAAGGKPVPEGRLPPMVIGGILFATGLFWFGWTAAPDIPWPAPVVAGLFIGAGFNTIFQQCINFLVDTYGRYSASAVSANTILRSAFASGLPMATKYMFHALGVGPAMSLLGGVATIAIPVPFLFMAYGKSLRRKSRFATA